MKTNVTYVDAAKFEAILLASGLPFAQQKGFVKVMGASGRNLYVAATKRVGRLDLSGFVIEGWAGGQSPHCGEFGNVRQQLRFDRPEAEILMDFAWLLAHLAALPPAPKPERKAAAPKEGAPKGWSGKPAQAPADRMALIEKVAREKGVKVSPKASSSPEA